MSDMMGWQLSTGANDVADCLGACEGMDGCCLEYVRPTQLRRTCPAQRPPECRRGWRVLACHEHHLDHARLLMISCRYAWYNFENATCHCSLKVNVSQAGCNSSALAGYDLRPMAAEGEEPSGAEGLGYAFGPMDVSPGSDNGTCADTIGFREPNNQYCKPAKVVKTELDLSSFQYESFYASYAWTNAFMVIIAGIIVDKLGNHLALALFSFNCLLGSSMFALGATLNMYNLMLVGRIIFGLGNGSLTIVQNKITATWFKGKELALAFGFTMSMSRAGSVLNFNLSPLICDKIGLVNTLWFGVGLTGIGLVAAVTVSMMDSSGQKRLAMQAAAKAIPPEKPTPFSVKDVFKYPASFWALTAALCFFYNGIFPFMAEAPDFIRMKYKKSPQVAGVIAGICYDMSMILSPFMGGIIDRVGKRGYLTLLCGLGIVPVFALLWQTDITPLVPIIALGCFYSLAASALWSAQKKKKRAVAFCAGGYCT